MKRPRLRRFGFCAALVLSLLLLTQCTQAFYLDYAVSSAPTEDVSMTGAVAAVPPPSSLEELLAQATLILVGEIAPHIELGFNCGYAETGVPDSPCSDESEISPYVYTRYTVLPEVVLRDDGIIASGLPIFVREAGRFDEQIVMQTRGQGTPYTLSFPPSVPGDRYLYLLSPMHPNADTTVDGYTSVHASWGRLLIDGDILRRSDSNRTPLDFGDGRGHVTVDRFLEAALGDSATTIDDLPPTGMVAIAPWSPLPTPTPYPTPDPVEQMMGQFSRTRRQATERIAWLQDGGEETLVEINALVARLWQDPDMMGYTTDWHLPPNLIIQWRSPNLEEFTKEYLQGVSWADRVVLLDDDQAAAETPTPWPTATPTVEPLAYFMQTQGMTQAEALAHLAWMESREEQWLAEAETLRQRLWAEEWDYYAAFVRTDPMFTVIVRLDARGPDEAAFAKKYLQGMEWADRVVLEYIQ